MNSKTIDRDRRSSGNCTTLLEGYWAVLGPDFRTAGPKRRPGAQIGALPQPGLCQGGGNVGYRSSCHLLEKETTFRVFLPTSEAGYKSFASQENRRLRGYLFLLKATPTVDRGLRDSAPRSPS